jgi:hypothetical protein
MEKLEMLAYLIVRFGLMALVVAVGAAMLYPLVSRWKWLVEEEERGRVIATKTPPRKRDLLVCDGCEIEYDIKGLCEYRTYDEDGNKQDYEICQGCYNEIMDSWA